MENNYDNNYNNGYNNYQQPYQPYPVSDMSVGAWIGTLILTAIPVVNLIMLIVWAVSGSPEKQSRKNWAIAQLILMVVIYIIGFLVVYSAGLSLASLLF